MAETTKPAPAAIVIVALVLVQVFFGVHYLAAKIVLEEIPPRAWALMRIAGAAVLLGIATLAAGKRLPTGAADLGALALFSVFGVIVNQVLFVEGLSRTTPTHSSLMNTMIPVLTMLFAVALRQERVRGRKVAALLVAVAGVLLVILPGSNALTSRMRAGDLLTLANASSFSLFLVLSRRIATRTDPLAATAVLLGFGTLGIAVVGLPDLLALDLGSISRRTWGLGTFIVLFPTAGAYLLSYWALGKVESSMVAFFIFLQPVIAAALSMLILGERPGHFVLFGAALIFAGVYLSIRARPPGKPA